MNKSKDIKEKKTIKITVFEMLLTWIVLISIIAITLLVFNIFNSINSLVIGTILLTAICLIFKVNIELKFREIPGWLLLILLLALLFRAKPYFWVMGGQDQGLYVNMSSYYENYGSTFIKDRMRESLGDEKNKSFYDSLNQYNIFRADLSKTYPKINLELLEKLSPSNINVLQHIEYSFHCAGIFIKDMEKSEYVFQFYPLHPLWISLFAKLAGSNNRVYSQVFFSLMTIILFYLIAFEFTGNNKAGYVVAFFLSINPLHAFFSKFPVSEIPSLFFSSGGFYFLIKFYNQRKKEVNLFYLYLSAG